MNSCNCFTRRLAKPANATVISSAISRLWITPMISQESYVASQCRQEEVKLIVVTDNERILGLGDQGAGGWGSRLESLLFIPRARAFIFRTLPISLDVEPIARSFWTTALFGVPPSPYSWRAYDEFIEAFVEGVSEVFRMWCCNGGFKQHNAFASWTATSSITASTMTSKGQEVLFLADLRGLKN